MVTDEPAQWKWAILSVHNALQGALVCHLSGSANVGALSESCVKKWNAWHEKDRSGKAGYPPNDFLADAKTLFMRLHEQSLRFEGGVGVVLVLSEARLKSFHRLHDLRNKFAHLTPMGWSIEIDGLPQIFEHILDVLDDIASDPYPFRHMNRKERIKLDTLLAELRAAINELKE